MPSIDAGSLRALRSRLSPTAAIYLEGDSGYDVKQWTESVEKLAVAVSYPANAKDVGELLAFVQGAGVYFNQPPLVFALKGGEYSDSEAFGSEGGIVINLQPHMHHVKIDVDNRLAYVGGGASWKHVDQAAIEYGLAAVAGVVSYTREGGLGGGRGWLTGQHGLVIDNIVQATLVSASGTVLIASEEENTDLYWALRGGDNFGVVTEFVFRLHPQQSTIFHHFFVFAPKTLLRLTEELNSWMEHRGNTENGSLVFALCPMGTPVIVLRLIYNGDDQEGREKYQRFVDLGPMMHKPETIREHLLDIGSAAAERFLVAYLSLNQLQGAGSAHDRNKLVRESFIPATPLGIPTSLMQTLFDSWSVFVCANAAASKSTILIELHHPDKAATVLNTDTAFAFRQPNYAVVLKMHWTDTAFSSRASEASVQILNSFEQARTHVFSSFQNAQGTSIDHVDGDARAGENNTHAKFGPNHARLIEVKLKYDPEMVFGKVGL